MKYIFIFFILFITSLTVLGKADAQFKYLDTYQWDGVPTNRVASDTECNADFIAKIALTLPEKRSVPTYSPKLLSTNCPKTISLSDEADVWITYVDEGANYKNALGFYTYNSNTPPTNAPAENDITIIFANTSNAGSGGGMGPGYKVYLGKFSANTTIAFALIVDGWNGSSVVNTNGILYANAAFNPEKEDSLKNHIVMVNDAPTGKLVIGFEDIRRDSINCDHDFNDVLFYATIKSRTSVEHSDSIPNLISDGKEVNTGNSGGLESKSLGDIIGKRLLNKYKVGGNLAINYSLMPKLTNKGKYATFGSNSTTDISTVRLASIMPTKVYDSGYTAYITSPNDITGFTNAVEVNAIDFVKDSICKAVAFATKSIGSIYAHTKPICDRLRGGQILNVESFTLQNLTFVRYTVKRSTGNIEYATSFSVGTAAGRKNFSFQSNWLTKDYQNDETMYNYQLWAAAPYLVTDMILEVLNKLKTIAPIEAMSSSALLPAAFIKAAQRHNGILQLTLNSLSKDSLVSFEVEEKSNEQAIANTTVYPFSITANGTTAISININDAYEHNIRLMVNGKLQDLLYMSDGNWSVDYDKNATSVTRFTVSNAEAETYSTDLPLYRNIHLEATTSTYVSIYKLLKGGGATQDLTSFKSINFTASGGNNLRITLLKNSIANWSNQYTLTIPLADESKDYSINLSDLKSALNAATMDLSDVTTIVFSIEIPSGQTTSVNANFSNVGFSKSEAAIVVKQASVMQEVQVYPNPSNGKLSLSFSSSCQRVYVLSVTDISTGKTIFTQRIEAAKGNNLKSIDFSNRISTSSICVLSMVNEEGAFNFTNKKVIVRK